MAKHLEVHHHHHYAEGTNVTHVAGDHITEGSEGQEAVDALMQVLGGAQQAVFGNRTQVTAQANQENQAGQQAQATNRSIGQPIAGLTVPQIMVSEIAGALFGREHHGLKRESAVRIAGRITRSILDEVNGNLQLAALATPFAVGYVNHGQGKYKVTTIASRSVEAANSICALESCEVCAGTVEA